MFLPNVLVQSLLLAVFSVESSTCCKELQFIQYGYVLWPIRGCGLTIIGLADIMYSGISDMSCDMYFEYQLNGHYHGR